ncbi:uncharacterized protein [Watersipora subatra]|uniref:uncharacterized protein n=1 Tax=Watersipora subatra TaxID=2589382 RepID=UPI00355C89CA
MDAIVKLGGVNVDVHNGVKFGGEVPVISKWKDDEPILQNHCSEYKTNDDDGKEFDEEVQRWIDDEWLELYDSTVHGHVEGIIPLMAAKQPNKPNKIRPVMDYRELNNYIHNNPGVETAICQEKLRNWGLGGSKACLLDLKKAYLQVHIEPSLKKFQAVRYRGKTYVMTHMGFGLNVATKIMSKIIDKVLSLDEQIFNGTDHYIDDIWVNEEVVQADFYVKRLTNDIDWSETVPSSVKSLLDEIFQRVQEQDPVRGKWDVKKTSQCTVWCDASNLALGVSLEINSVIEDTKRPKVTGLSELIIRRRLGIIGQLIDEYGLTLMIKIVSSDKIEDVKKVHQDHHFGVSKTLYLAQKKLGRTIKKDMSYVFSLWFKLANETSDVVIKQLENVFRERRPPKEFLSDNGPCFTSARMKEFLQKWSVEQILSCAYKLTGNGIIERHHRTIKRAVMRTGKRPEEIAYWYNNLPNSNGIEPVEELYSYRSDLTGVSKSTEIPQKLSDNRDCSLNP